jgi:long-chain-fatty-acid--[acyl-carrier-protein] ligase
MREDDIAPGTIGKLLPSVRAMVIDIDTHQPVTPGQTGMLLIRGPSIFSGYLNHDGPSPFERLENEIWYRTGDLVTLDEQQRLIFKGRLKRFTKIAGEMVSLGAIEEVLLQSYARPGDQSPCLAVLSTSDEQHPELVLFTTRALDQPQVNKTIDQAGLSGLHHIRIVQEVSGIPVLGTGKPDYRTLAQLLTPRGNPTETTLTPAAEEPGASTASPDRHVVAVQESTS